MTPDEQRIAIAKFRGYTHMRWVADRNPDSDRFGYFAGSLRNVDYDESEVPDYLNDRNAIHEVICNIHPRKNSKFADCLADLLGYEPDDYRDRGTDRVYDVNSYQICGFVIASNAQLCEAFLKSHDLWT